MKKPPGRPPNRTPLSEQDLELLKYQSSLNETGESILLPKHPHVLGPLAHLLYCQIEGLDEKTAAMIDFDSDSIHLNPEALRPPGALRLIVRLLLIIIESLDPRSASRNKLMVQHVLAREHQIRDTMKRKAKTTDATRYSRIFDDARFENLIFDQIHGKHDITGMKKQRELVYTYIGEHPLPAQTRTEHEAKRVFQKWVDDHRARLVPRLRGIPCLCDYRLSRPIKLPKIKTATPIKCDPNPDPDTDATEIKRGMKFKKNPGLTALDLACTLLGHIHDLNSSTIKQLLKQKTPE